MSDSPTTHNGSHPHGVAHQASVPVPAVPANKMRTVDREVKFSFKKQMIKDDLGQEIKRPPVVITIPVPTFEGLVSSLENEKVQQFVLDLVEDAVKNQAKEQVSDEDKPVNRQEELDINKLTLEYISSIPKSERTGGGIPKEVWDDFEKDYVRTIVEHTDKGEDRATKAAKLLVAKFAPVRSDKNVIKFLQQQLSIWATNSENVDEFAEVFKYLDDRAHALLNRDSAELLASL